MELQLIQNKIYEIRGQKVMLDRDLAEMYGVETRVLNQAVKRNIERFPEDFMFQLTENEFQNLISQFVTSSWGGIRKLPNVFTVQGVAMLSSVLRSETAIQVNIAIVRAFVAIRQSLSIKPAYKISEYKTELDKLKEYIEEILPNKTILTKIPACR